MILCVAPTGVSLCFIVMAEDAFWSQFLEISDSSSDDDELMLMCLVDEDEQMYESSQEYPIKRGGSRPGRAPNKDRRRRLYARLLFDDYWGESPLYDEKQFRRTYRMPRKLFDDILERVTLYDNYFVQKRDACKVLLNRIVVHTFQ